MSIETISTESISEMLIHLPAVAYDPGFGNTKVCVAGRSAVVTSAVARAKDNARSLIGLRAAGRAKTVSVGAEDYLVGDGAWYSGQPLGTLDYGSLVAADRLPLLYAGLAALLEPGSYLVNNLAVGLPVPLLQNADQAKAVLDELRGYKRPHDFRLKGKKYSFEVERIRVLPQPVGAYADWLLDDQLRIRSGRRHAEVGVIDIGLNTLDLYVLMAGQAEPRYVGGAKAGVRRLLDLINGSGRDLIEVDSELRSGALPVDPGSLAIWLGQILGEVERTWPALSRFSAVIPTGGGARLLGERLARSLVARGAAVSWPADPVTANVSGLWKWTARRTG